MLTGITSSWDSRGQIAQFPAPNLSCPEFLFLARVCFAFENLGLTVAKI